MFYYLHRLIYPDSTSERTSVFSLKGVALGTIDMNAKTTELLKTMEPVQLINSFHLVSFNTYMVYQ